MGGDVVNLGEKLATFSERLRIELRDRHAEHG